MMDLPQYYHESHDCQIIYDSELKGNITFTDPTGHSAIIPGECLRTFIGDWLSCRMGFNNPEFINYDK